MTADELETALRELHKYYPTIEYQHNMCSCCPPSEYVTMEKDTHGDYVKWYDLMKLVNIFKQNQG
jgi:hypothetical protein